MTQQAQFDIIIIGAGPAGLSFARSLSDTGLQIVLLERQAESILENPPEDGRDIALTHSSEKIMRDLGMWDLIPETEIGTIRDAKVVNGKSPYALHFASENTDRDYLGHIIPNHIIRQAAYMVVEDLPNVTIMTEAEVVEVETNSTAGKVTLKDGTEIGAPLVISADSRFSDTRRQMGISSSMTDFGRVVIVCEMEHTISHNDTAVECFHFDQTLAILPMYGNKSSVVVTLTTDKAEAVMNMPPEAFAADIQRRFEGQLGDMTLVSKRHPYPLVGVFANQFVKKRFAVVGDAAVGMHPVTAHGFNLGLTGANILAEEIRSALEGGSDIGASWVLKNYEFRHRRIARPLYLGTNALVRLYTNTTVPGRILRRAALRVGNIIPPVKQLITRQLTQA
ncbi:ubiquinone biosynthesis protein UbiH [Rhodobacterales bacterium 52_120_T64]|nr:ubiquinone biosynthesis protein UbiH [Rhodobacterales bacterium 52_120_T64]